MLIKNLDEWTYIGYLNEHILVKPNSDIPGDSKKTVFGGNVIVWTNFHLSFSHYHKYFFRNMLS